MSSAHTLITRLIEKKWTIGVAESCTGGALGAALVDISGASQVFLGGIISYSNAVKISHLHVPAALLDTHGAVSAQVATVMASGAAQALGVDIALSITGIAGPNGGSADKPVGTVYIGRCIKGICEAKHFLFTGDRTTIRAASVQNAIAYALEGI